MITIQEYLLSKSKPLQKSNMIKSDMIKATNENIRYIVKDELEKLGPDADLNHIDTSEVTNMCDLFKRNSDFNGDISMWDTSKVESMNSMFYACYNFNCDIGRWNVSNVKDMYQMFYNCYSFNQDIGDWKVDNVGVVRDMFCDCRKFDQDLSKWNMPNAGPIYDFDMFYNCPIKYKEDFLPKIKFM